MATATASTEPFQIGRVINRAFNTIGGNFVSFFIMTVVAVLPLSVINYENISLTQEQVAKGLPANPLLVYQSSPVFGIAFLAYFVFTLVLQSALARGTIVHLSGRKASIGDCIGTGISILLPCLGIGVLVGLGVAAGLILLIVPGIMLAVRWIVALPARVAEGPGILRAMGRSAELTSGHRWSVLGVGVVTFLIIMGISIVIGIVNVATIFASGGATTPVGIIVSVIVSTISSAIVLMVNSVTIATTYYELRTIKEGVGAEEIAKVFA